MSKKRDCAILPQRSKEARACPSETAVEADPSQCDGPPPMTALRSTRFFPFFGGRTLIDSAAILHLPFFLRNEVRSILTNRG